MSNINIQSILDSGFPNVFFESFSVSKINDELIINTKLCTRDFIKSSGEDGWFYNNNLNKYCSIKLAVVYDENLFNSVNKNNYISLIEAGQVEKKTIPILNISSDSKELEKQFIEYSDDESTIYKLMYDCRYEIQLEQKKFIGMIAYVYFDYQQYSKDYSIQIKQSSSNLKFILDKHIIFKDGLINKNISRWFINNDSVKELWCSEYSLKNGDAYAFVNQKEIKLENLSQEIFVRYRNILRPENRLRQINIKQPLKQNKDLGSAFTNFYTSRNDSGSLIVHFAIDILNFLRNRSSIFPFLKTKFIENNIETIKRFSNVINTEIRGEDNNSYMHSTNEFNFLSNSNSNSLIKGYEVRPSFIVNKKFNYDLSILISDGYKVVLSNLITSCNSDFAYLKQYYSLCQSMSSKKDSLGRNIYYDFSSDYFTDEFILLQNSKRSAWDLSKKSANTYVELYNAISEYDLLMKETEILNLISPENGNLESIGAFLDFYKDLLFKASKILELQKNDHLQDKYRLLNDTQQTIDNDFSFSYFNDEGYLFDRLNENQGKSFSSPKFLISKINSAIYKESFPALNNIFSQNNQNFKSSIFKNAVKKGINENCFDETQYLYKMLAENYPEMSFIDTGDFKFSTLNDYRTFLLSIDMQQIKSILSQVFKVSVDETLENTNQTKEEYVDTIMALMSKNKLFIYEIAASTDARKNNIVKDLDSFLLYSILSQRIVRIEYLKNAEDEVLDGSSVKKMKKLTWEIFDISNQEIKNSLKVGKKILIRCIPISSDILGANLKEFTNLPISNQYKVISYQNIVVR